ncbi:cytochrome C biogenesis protein CcdA [Vibrio sp. vnigr-6D03]|uniref:SPOR domain-containing protein n=1 Tax=Vibrio sp. vnigr-6D03 TaxID=2058088 RepID=UPI000C34EAAF|nr:SPOR domain-containing protein [Vibrio sp. vnigr-6D03]PKF76987.1 cytochrome C biogenesis protein CcdA [Vibrio sp. vnigr-6D03]
MKKISIISLSILLAACASDTYEKGVTSESYTEDYKVDSIQAPITQQAQIQEVSINETPKMAAQTTTPMVAVREEKKVVKLAPKPQVQKKKIKILPPTHNQLKSNPRYGYTIQVIALDRESKLERFANRLPKGQPIWGNYKQVNGTNWYTILYGDYATSAEAKAAIATLPEDFKKLKPFPKSIDAIKNSDYPVMDKLN